MRCAWISMATISMLCVGCAEGNLQSSATPGQGGAMMAAGGTVMTGGGGGTVGSPPQSPTPTLDPNLPPGTVVLTTSMGRITLALDSGSAPNTVANFKSYVDEGFYDGDDGAGNTVFHRVISGFMIQGGGVKLDGQLKLTRAPIPHEGNTGISNVRGTVAMARTNDPNSATSQFFINHVDNSPLDYVSPDGPGYVAFARVTEGLDVVDAIAAVEIGAMDVPTTPITIDDVRRGP